MFGFFSSSIKVTFIDHASGEVVGTSNMKRAQLPASFDKPTTMQLLGKEWRVLKADPADSDAFSSTKKLTLYLQRIEQLNPRDLLFSIPTISNELPATTDSSSFYDFVLELHEDDWRQTELLPLALLSEIQAEMAAVEAVLFPEDGASALPGYQRIHVRDRIGQQNCSIPFEAFCSLIQVEEKGALRFTGHPGYVKDGFALRSGGYTYYGTVENQLITALCLQQFDQADDVFSLVAASYGLVLVVWCGGQIITV